MIRVNLLPGGKKRAAKGSRSGGSLPSFKNLPLDRWVIGGGLVALVCLAMIALRFQSARSASTQIAAGIEQQLEDSVRFADLIVELDALQARRDSVAARVQIIQELDLDRYLAAHVLDEVARAVPDFTWLTGVTERDADPWVEFQIEGSAGSIPAVTMFMENLSASPFIGLVDLVRTQMVTGQDGGSPRNVFEFTLLARYERPPLEFLETAPLFTGQVAIPDASTDGGDPPMEG